MTYFKKTAAGIHELAPEEVKELYRTAILEQSEKIVRAAGFVSTAESTQIEKKNERLNQHKKTTLPKLENTSDFGHQGIYCMPTKEISIPVDRLKQFIEAHRGDFSEVMRFFPLVDVFQNGVSAGYFPTAIRKDIKSTARVTLYTDGLAAYDSQEDLFMDGHKRFNTHWLSYEIQRQLQLAKALLQDYGVDKLNVTIELNGIEDFQLKINNDRIFLTEVTGSYTGSHKPIDKTVPLEEIHDYNGNNRNIVMPIVKDTMDEICRIFGFSKTPPGAWDEKGYLSFVKGLESQR
jgi:hypothetical protein